MKRQLPHWSLLWLALVVMALVQSKVRAQETPSVAELIGTAALCAIVERSALADMPVAPLYRVVDGSCETYRPGDSAVAPVFQDATCETEVRYAPTNMQQYCADANNNATLGEARGAIADTWTLTPGSRFNIGSRDLDGVPQPYLQRVSYFAIDAPAGGTCTLEMRVYSAHPGNTDQPAMIAFHGGSWSSRGFGFLGLELTIPHFVDQGFVVFAPFYRLLGDSEGSAACRAQSIEALVSDAGAALTWVEDNAERYGATGKPVVFGQSAGAHLALRLAIDSPDSLSGVVGFYPPTDFTDFTQRAKSGAYTDEQGLGILQRVLGVSVEDAMVSEPPVPLNSFPQRMVGEDARMPPTFLLHGAADTLVEARQSMRLCDAMAGRPLLAVDQEIEVPTALRTVSDCSGSDMTGAMQLIREGQHALDICPAGVPLLVIDSCLAGSEQSRQEVATAINDAAEFALATTMGTAVAPEPAASSSGSGATGWLLLLLVSACGWRLAVRQAQCLEFSQ